MGEQGIPVSEKAGVVDSHDHVGDPKSRPESHGSSKLEDSTSGNHADDAASEQHIFSDPVVAEHWLAVYEKADYENRHRFDPTFKWTAEEERKLVRKIDRRIMVWAWIMFCGLDLHRRNINRAITDNMLPELGKFPGSPEEKRRHLRNRLTFSSLSTPTQA